MKMLIKQIAKQGFLLKNVCASPRAAYHGTGGKVSMNDLPIPRGDWKENYTRKNAKYNAFLFTGIAALVSTIAFVKSTNIIELNFSPPTSLD